MDAEPNGAAKLQREHSTRKIFPLGRWSKERLQWKCQRWNRPDAQSNTEAKNGGCAVRRSPFLIALRSPTWFWGAMTNEEFEAVVFAVCMRAGFFVRARGRAAEMGAGTTGFPRRAGAAWSSG